MPPVVQQGLTTEHRIALLVLSLALLGLVLELVRRGLLKERYALLWLATSGAGFVVGLFPNLILRVAEIARFQYITLFYVVSFLFLLAIVLAFTVVISRLVERNRELTQEVAILANTLKKLEGKIDDKR